MRETVMTVGSTQQVIDRYGQMREVFGDHQRQLFLLKLPGMSLTTSMEQLDALGEIGHALRREFDRNRPPEVPDGPTHAARVAHGADTAVGDPSARSTVTS